MTVLVTGIAGFIGSHLGENLVSAGQKVIGIDNFDNYYSREIKEGNLRELLKSPEFSFIEADIRNVESVSTIFRKFDIDMVVHLAARAGVRPSLVSPQEYMDVNVMGTLNLLEAMKLSNARKMIFASSSSVYGNNQKVPFSETDVVDYPISPYASSKKACELLCHTYHHLYGFDIFCLRFFTVYGPRQRPDLAIYKFTKALLEDGTIPFYGDGSTRRDYTYIDDILQGILNSVDRISGYEIINLGESRTICLGDLIRLLETATKKKARLEYLPMQPGDVKQTYADISKARSILDYNPKMGMEEGLERFVTWYKAVKNLI